MVQKDLGNAARQLLQLGYRYVKTAAFTCSGCNGQR